MKYKQGIYQPQNPEKWVLSKKSITQGNFIRYMSSYELRAFKFLDFHPQILKISSEPFPIEYISPIDNKPHRYYPDLIVKTETKTFLVEIKPQSQVDKPILRRKTEKSILRYRKEYQTWLINQEKWKSAREFCEKNNLQFLILSESHLKIS